MRRFGRFAMLTVVLAVVVVGCGGGSGTTNASNGGGPDRTSCIYLREGSIGFGTAKVRRACAEVGVTGTSPPLNSAVAVKARERREIIEGEIESSEPQRNGSTVAELPIEERGERLQALVEMIRGKVTQARASLRAGCPKASAAELAAAYVVLEELAESSVGMAGAREALEEVCPL